MKGRIAKLLTGMIVAVVLIGAINVLVRNLQVVQPPAPSGSPSYSALTNGPAFEGALDTIGPIINFTSNIPVIVLRTGQAGPINNSKTYTGIEMDIYEPASNQPARIGARPSFSTHAGLRMRGQVSRSFPKLSFRLQIQTDNGQKDKRSLLGMPAESDWVLHGPWLDKSLIRNAFSYDLAKAMGCSAMRTRPCEVFLNTSGTPVTESDYVGVYQLIEHIERGENRVQIAKLASDQNAEPDVSGGYLLSWDVGPGTYLPWWKSIQVRYPSHPTSEQMLWIDQALTRFDMALKGPDSRDPVKGYAAHIEVDDWVNYVLFEELIFNLDAYVRSFYLQKDRGSKIRPGPVWDHDLALGHQFPPGTAFTNWWYDQRGAPHRWVPELAADAEFSKKTSGRWADLRKGILSDDRMDSRIMTFAEPLLMGPADRNFKRWRILDLERPYPKPNDYITIATTSYSEQIEALKKFIHQRAAWMDAKLLVKGDARQRESSPENLGRK